MLTKDLSFPELYTALSRRWPWLVMALLIGALAGALAGQVLPARIRATASLGIGVDYGRSLPLTAEQERLALLHVQELILDDATLLRAAELAAGSAVTELPSNAAELRQRIRLDRYENRWDLIVEAPSEAEAEHWADAWSAAGVEALESAVGHALRAQELQGRIYALGCRLVPAGEQDQALWQCGTSEAIAAGAELTEALVAEIQLSQGILPALTFARLRSGEGSATASRPATPWLAVAGAVVGGAWMLIVLLWLGGGPAGPQEPDRGEADGGA